MSKPIISVRNLGKHYRLGAGVAHNTLRDHIADGMQRVFSRSKKTSPPNHRIFGRSRTFPLTSSKAK